ncbi:MAG: hypothetical protein HN341_14065 [Verrucomicrobia bacterium]|jgi:hypothetical protein|nr:hypothetical protein [Verrucomicrobiota bacterium]
MMRIGKQIVCTSAALAVGVTIAMAAAPVDRVETWSAPGIAGWTNSADPTKVVLSNPGNYLNLEFSSTEAPQSLEDTVRMAIGSGMLLTNLTFVIEAVDIFPSSASVSLHSAAEGHVWTRSFPLTNVSQSASIEVPVAFSAGWFRGIRDTETQFLSDLRTVDWVGVSLSKHATTKSQNYALDDFRIQGVLFSGDADMDYMADAWENSHGLDASDYSDAGLDADGDGMSNYAEYRTGSDPNDFSSRFEVDVDTIEGATGVSFELEWASLVDREYTIWRSTNLLDGFTPLVTGEVGVPPTNVFTDATATDAGPYFYRIEVEPEF